VAISPCKIDPPKCRVDLVLNAATTASSFQSAFDWIDETQALRAGEDPQNRGLTAREIRDLAQDWIVAGNKIRCVPEKREIYRDRRHFHYDVIVENLDEFPRGLYVEMELANSDEDDPTVNVLNAHPPSR